MSYSNIEDADFDCGRYKLLEEINREPLTFNDNIPVDTVDAEDPGELDLRTEYEDIDDNYLDDEDLVFSFSDEGADYFCSGTIINDR